MNNYHVVPHVPVMLNEVLDSLAPRAGESYLDLTAGYAGHALAIGDKIGHVNLTLVDRDQTSVDYLSLQLPGSEIVHTDYASYLVSSSKSDKRFDMILADLGISSVHVDDHSRGFSFSGDGPLDMRMDVRQSLTALAVVNEYPEDQIADILYQFAEIKNSRKVARLVVESRPYHSTSELALVVAKSGSPRSKKHPATLVFQALRIHVNDELGQLSALLQHAPQLLNPGGRLAIISFHSLEDRLIKRSFNELGQDTFDSLYRIQTKKPIVPSPHEIALNPRARSAKLRVLQRK